MKKFWKPKNWFFMFGIFLTLGGCEEQQSEKVKIGMIQVIEHPALDLNRKGIIQALEEKGYVFSGKKANAVVMWESAQANPSLAAQIAQKFIGQGVDILITLGTIPSQAAVQTRKGSKPFIVYTSVTDPQSARLLEAKNITGVSNYVSSQKQFAFMKQYVPSLKTVGIIYNPGDANASFLVADMEKGAKKIGLTLIFAQAHRTSEVTTAAQSLVGKVDALFVNNDNTALAAFESIVLIATEHKKPVFGSDIELLERGAFGALGCDQFLIGKKTGDLVVRALKGESFETEKLFYPTETKPYVR